MRRALVLALLAFVSPASVATEPTFETPGEPRAGIERLYLLASPARPAGPSRIVAIDIGPDGEPIPAESYPTGSDGEAFLSEQDVAITPDGSFLFAANNAGRSVSAFAIADDGALAPVPGSPFPSGGTPTALAVHPGEPYLYVSADGFLEVHAIAADGALSVVQSVFVGSGRDVEVAPSGEHLYVAIMFGASNGVAGFEIGSSGTLTELPGSPFGFATSRPTAIEIDSDGLRVHALDLDRGLATFEVDPFGGLTLLSQNDVGGFTTALETSSDDRFAYVGEYYEEYVLGFTLDADGSSSELPGSPFAARPTVIALLASPDGDWMYQITRETREVVPLAIEPDGALAAGDPVALPGPWVPNGAAFLAACTVTVDVDVRPGSLDNPVQPASRGVIPVAILGREDFDVMTIDVTTLRFGPAGAPPAHDLENPRVLAGHLVDLDMDGNLDLLQHFRTEAAGIACGDDTVSIEGETLDGCTFTGRDTIRTVGRCR